MKLCYIQGGLWTLAAVLVLVVLTSLINALRRR
jgi:hypothetical protein